MSNAIIKPLILKEHILGPIDSGLAASLVTRCFNARTIAHFNHLSTTSYSQHKALEEFYEEIVVLADKFCETSQGLVGILPFDQSVTFTILPPELNVEELMTWIHSNRSLISKLSTIQNIMDEILALCATTLYKLKNLH